VDPRAKGEGEARRGTGRHAGSGPGSKVGPFRSERKDFVREVKRGHQGRRSGNSISLMEFTVGKTLGFATLTSQHWKACGGVNTTVCVAFLESESEAQFLCLVQQ
jgi:hypothetical protein